VWNEELAGYKEELDGKPPRLLLPPPIADQTLRSLLSELAVLSDLSLEVSVIPPRMRNQIINRKITWVGAISHRILADSAVGQVHLDWRKGLRRLR
jgi:hypothetical protein